MFCDRKRTSVRAQRLHHALLNGGDLARVVGNVLATGRRAGLNKRRKGNRCRQALPELVVQVACERASFVLLNLQQPRGERSPRRVGAGKVLREVVDGIGDMVELGGAEARQAKGVVALLQLAQALDDRAAQATACGRS